MGERGVTDRLSIQLTNTARSFREITLRDVTGRALIQLPNQNGNYYELKLAGFDAGVYMLEVTDNEGKRFIKQIVLTK